MKHSTDKLVDWRGVSAILVLNAAPVLEFDGTQFYQMVKTAFCAERLVGKPDLSAPQRRLNLPLRLPDVV